KRRQRKPTPEDRTAQELTPEGKILIATNNLPLHNTFSFVGRPWRGTKRSSTLPALRTTIITIHTCSEPLKTRPSHRSNQHPGPLASPVILDLAASIPPGIIRPSKELTKKQPLSPPPCPLRVVMPQKRAHARTASWITLKPS